MNKKLFSIRGRHWAYRLGCMLAAVLAGLVGFQAELAAEDDGFFKWMLPAQELKQKMNEPALVVAVPDQPQGAFENKAWAFMQDRAPGIDNAIAELAMYRHETSDTGHHHFRFHHVVNGVRIGETDLLLHMTSAGTVFGFNGFSEPKTAQLRDRVYAHIGSDGLQISPAEVLAAITADADVDSDQVELTDIYARIDERYEVVYWLARTRINGDPQTTIYHIGDSADAPVLFKNIEFRTFLPFYE